MPEYLIPSKVGVGPENVDLIYSFETDEEGIFNASVEEVLFENVNIISCLTHATILELESEAAKFIDDKMARDKDEAQIAKWEDQQD